ncbi:MAG: hypothetical protein ACI835_000016 [Planctomycetota bacterium]|jgi:hypothetical protein
MQAIVGAGSQAHVGGTGRAYLFNATTGAELAVLESPTAGNALEFGTSAAISKEYALVGEPGRELAHLYGTATGAHFATFDGTAFPAISITFGREVAASQVFDPTYSVGQELRQTAAVTSGPSHLRVRCHRSLAGLPGRAASPCIPQALVRSRWFLRDFPAPPIHGRRVARGRHDPRLSQHSEWADSDRALRRMEQ